LAPAGANSCDAGSFPLEATCENEADRLARRLWFSDPANRLTAGLPGRKELIVGSWNHVPYGCSIQSAGDLAAHFNRNPGGQNPGSYSLVCGAFHLAPQGANSCNAGLSAREWTCEHAADQQAQALGRAQGRQELIVGSWGHVPYGCSIKSAGDWAAHFNTYPDGQNDGSYSLVCIGEANIAVETKAT